MKRKEILPTWIRFFAWIFLFCAIIPLAYISSLVSGSNLETSAFGIEVIESQKEPALTLYLSSLLTLASIVAYGILWGKKWALDLGVIYGIIALATNIYANVQGIIELYSGRGFNISLELLFLIPFIYTLYQKRNEWRAFPIQGVHDELAPLSPTGANKSGDGQ